MFYLVGYILCFIAVAILVKMKFGEFLVEDMFFALLISITHWLGFFMLVIFICLELLEKVFNFNKKLF